MVHVIAIDYSIVSPAVCVFDNSTKFENTKIYYLTKIKSLIGLHRNMLGELYNENYKSDTERFSNIADWVIRSTTPTKNDIIAIEDYSLNSVGKQYNIAENCGILKYKLYCLGIQPILVAPTVIKKYAGKGNYDKEKMHNAFVEKTGFNLHEYLTPHKKLGNPTTDIVDAWFLGSYIFSIKIPLQSP